jgi:uncharacterized membrane protein YjgN (DUF898 family)
VLPLFAAAFLIFNISAMLYGVWASNIIWSSIEFGSGHRVRRGIPIAGYFWLVATNKIACLLSLGFSCLGPLSAISVTWHAIPNSVLQIRRRSNQLTLAKPGPPMSRSTCGCPYSCRPSRHPVRRIIDRSLARVFSVCSP